jgi:HlyD family secretion protein
MRARLYVLAALIGVVALGVGYWRFHAKRHPHRGAYKTAAVEKREIVGRVTASGTLSALVTVQVGTQVSGRIQNIFVDYNSPVKKGEVVAKIDPQLIEAQVRQAQANYLAAKAGVATAEANLANSDKQHTRIEALHEQELASQADFDNAETNVADAARASVAQAAAQLNQTQVSLSFTSIVSPIDGVVISRSVDTGQTVAASLSAPTLFTIAQDLTKMQLDTNIAEGDVGRLRVGMKAYFTVDSFPGEKFFGKIRQIRDAPTTVQNVVTYDAAIDVDNADLGLRPGMTANVTIVYDERPETLAVPNTALRFRPPAGLLAAASTREARRNPRAEADGGAASDPPGGKSVWVLRKGAPHMVTLRPGLTDGTFTEVATGDLSEGDQVVVDTVEPEGAPSATGASASLRRMF